VARERKYLAILEAFPVEAMRAFVLNQIRMDAPAFAAVEGGDVVERAVKALNELERHWDDFDQVRRGHHGTT